MNNDNSSKQILLSVLGVAILVVAVVGVSFAAFTFAGKSEVENTITTGTITVSYTEGGTGIKLENAMPMKDETGKIQSADNTYFDFTVDAQLSSGATPINYEITAKKDSEQSDLPDNAVKLYLEKVSAVGSQPSTPGEPVKEPTLYSEDTPNQKTNRTTNEMVLKDAVFSNSETTVYRLRMWVAENYGDSESDGASFASSKKFIVKVNVYAQAKATE